MFDLFSNLISTRADDRLGGWSELNFKLTQFAEKKPKAALTIVGVLLLVIVVLAYKTFL